MTNPTEVMGRARAFFEQSGLTLDDVGRRMGYPPKAEQQRSPLSKKDERTLVSTIK